MRVLFTFFWAFLATCAALNDTIVDVQEERDDILSLRPLFRAWMKHHNISIPPSKIAHRLRIFAANHAFILSHNAQQHPRPSYTLGHNRFSHLTFDEFRAMHLGFTRPTTAFPPSFEEDETPQNDVLATSRSLRGHLSTTDKNHAIGMNTERFPPYTFPRPAWLPHIENPSSSLPPSIDWVEKGAVTPIKDQGQCGSCYSFSAVGAVEGAYYLQTGVLSEFSMQEIVDCDGLDGGCQGGEMQQTFKWMQMNGGLCLLSDYPYVSGTTAEEQAVCLPCPVVPGTAPEKWITVRRNSMTELQEAVAAQPVSVAVGASRAWMFYEAGVFDGKCEQELNHGVLCVGYGGGEGSEEGQYWKVKNSWGPEWGMEGYILLKRDDFDKQAACGIMEDASYPILPSVPGMTGNESARPPVISQTDRSSGSTAGLNPLQGSATARDCGGSTAIFSNVRISPDAVEKNELVTVIAEGTLTKPTLSGMYTLSVVYEGAQLYSHAGDVCGNETVALPLNAGTVHVFGFACPANPGPVSYGLDVILPSIAPSGEYLISIKGHDQDNAQLVCIEADLKL